MDWWDAFVGIRSINSSKANTFRKMRKPMFATISRRYSIFVLATIIVGTAFCGWREARADDVARITAIDFLLDWKQYRSKRVTVTDCAFLMVGNSLIYCYANPKQNLTNALLIDGDTLPRDAIIDQTNNK
jgi:hypothetical protein